MPGRYPGPSLACFQSIVPVLLEEPRSPHGDEEQHRKRFPILEYEGERRRHQRKLPHNSHHHVERISAEGTVQVETQVARTYLFEDWFPKAPGPY